MGDLTTVNRYIKLCCWTPRELYSVFKSEQLKLNKNKINSKKCFSKFYSGLRLTL